MLSRRSGGHRSQAPEQSPDRVVSGHVQRSQGYTTLMLVALPAWGLYQDPPDPVILVLLLVLWAGFLLLHAGIIGWIPVPRHWRGPVVYGQALFATGTAAFGFTSGEYGLVWLVLAGVAAANVVAEHRAEQRVAWSFGMGVLAAAGVLVMLWLTGDLDRVGPSVAGAFLVVALIGYWESAGPLLARRTAAAEVAAVELAAARERLRISEELHDVLGRALEVVAFRGELASRLVEADPERARSEMEQVQTVARDAVHDVRSLVRSAQSVDVRHEVESARTLLESAGTSVTVSGDPDAVPEQARGVLGRLVREAATNILRHAQARNCEITVGVGRDKVSLEVRNDGAAPDPEGAGAGTGLAAVRRALEEAGGRLEVAAEDGGFVLRGKLRIDGADSRG